MLKITAIASAITSETMVIKNKKKTSSDGEVRVVSGGGREGG